MSLRDNITHRIKSEESNFILLELPTGFGKTRLALQRVEQLNPKNILVVINRKVHIGTWSDEFKKWGYDNFLKNTTFTTYVSLGKHVGKWDLIIFDEAHHLSDRCLYTLSDFSIRNSILLSATIGRDKKNQLKSTFPGLAFLGIKLKEAVEQHALPKPKVFKVPMSLKDIKGTFIYKKRFRECKASAITTNYNDRWKYLKRKANIDIVCTAEEYHNLLVESIEFYKNRTMRFNKQLDKHRWLNLCLERLKWFASLKNEKAKEIIQRFSDARTITFCSDIKQTEELGSNCINSKNKEASIILEKFNNKEISNITACNMLNEGVNLVECKVGIFVNITSSEIITVQRIGRLLRHPNPVVVLIYFKDTREEEIINNIEI